MWDFTGEVDGRCINDTALFYATSSISILVDIWILLLPVTTLLKVQRPRKEKAALVGIFSLGVFSTIASIVRLHAIRIYTESDDPFFDSVPINLWSEVEVNIGILCASIPSLKALFLPGQRQRSRSNAYQYHSGGKSGLQEVGGSGIALAESGDRSKTDSFALDNIEAGSGQGQSDILTPPSLQSHNWIAEPSRECLAEQSSTKA